MSLYSDKWCKIIKKVNVVAKTPSTSKYINHFRFYIYREDGAKKWEVAAIVVVEATVLAGVIFFEENLIHKCSLN